MPRIKDSDVVLVRERARIDDVIREVVTLKNAGGGSLKGLCPFHDERSPSFNVTPSKGFWHCFGCQAGGDVIDFVRKYDHLEFSEAVEKLAARTGIQLHYEEGGSVPDRQRGQRIRLVQAHHDAAEFYQSQLGSPEAQIGRTFLAERDFDQAAAEKFGVGFAPPGWDALAKHLKGKGYTDQELVAGGLAIEGNRGVYDRFRGRLMWPIRDLSGDVVGFGARRLAEDDQGPKYLNTPETLLYKKSNVLYGVDMARREISRQQRAVVVEGYTDVMAAHLSGVEIAVATCGTAFGSDHIKVLRRLLMDQDEFRGEVIFTFDGDEAGRKAALKAFGDDQKFVAQTYVAIEPNGLDPCELRQKSGPEAVRDLVSRRTPMFEFAIKSTLTGYDLDSSGGRAGALKAIAPMVAKIKDHVMRRDMTRVVAHWIGIEPAEVSMAVTSAGAAQPQQPARTERHAQPTVAPESVAGSAGPKWKRPDVRGTAPAVEREALKCALQIPLHVDSWYASVEPPAYTFEINAAVHAAITAAGTPGSNPDLPKWVASVLTACSDDDLRVYVRELAIEQLHTRGDDDEQLRVYGKAVISRLIEMDATRRIVEVKSRLQRTNPIEHAAEYNKLFGDLLAMEQVRRQLRENALGGLPVEGEAS